MHFCGRTIYLISQNKITKKTKAILPVHWGGASPDMKKICNIAKKYKIKTIEDVYNSNKFIVSFSPKLIKANNQIREFLKLNMYENKSIKEMTDKAEKIIKTLYIYLIKNNKKFLPSDIKNKWGLERSVADFIAGMTDKFAIDLYNKIR